MSGEPVARKKNQRRTTKKAILVVTNGEVTEKLYLEKLKQKAKVPNAKITVKAINGAPDKLLPGAKYSRDDYDDVWIVVDEDDHDESTLQKFLSGCAKQRCFGIVSRPCFEVWLVAHYAQVKRYGNQADVQNHLEQLSGRKGKTLPDNFPFNSVSEAIQRCFLPDASVGNIGELPASPGTAMPHLVRAFRVVDD